MSQAELTKRILDRLNKQVAFGGMMNRKTTNEEVILKCPIIDTSGRGSLEPLASDLTQIFMDYIAEAGSKRIKDIIKDILT